MCGAPRSHQRRRVERRAPPAGRPPPTQTRGRAGTRRVRDAADDRSARSGCARPRPARRECPGPLLHLRIRTPLSRLEQRLAGLGAPFGVEQALSKLVRETGEPRLVHAPARRCYPAMPWSEQERLLFETWRSRLICALSCFGSIPDERRVSDGDSILDQHAGDLTYHAPHRPDIVVFPESTEEVAAVLEYADAAGVPVVPFGAGTSLEGHVIPLHGGISLDLTRMNAIVAVRPDDLTATVQPGVTRSQLEAAVGPHGLWFPVDPGADATLGGMAATNASGTTTVRYGGMRAHVLALEVVLAGGRVVRTGTRAVKSSAGYNLTGLFVGSEGTLGVITELTLRLHPIPEHIVVARAAFPSIEAACRAAAGIIGSGVPVTRCELLDAMTIAALNAFSGTSFPDSPYLFVEFGGTEAGVAGDLATTREVAEDEGATAFESESDPDRAQPDVERAAQRADGVARARAGVEGDDDRRRGARIGAGGCDRACAPCARRVRASRRHRRPRRRRELPRRVPARSRRRRVDRAGGVAQCEPRRRRARARRHLHRRARHRLRQARRISSASTAISSRSIAASSSSSTRTGS